VFACDRNRDAAEQTEQAVRADRDDLDPQHDPAAAGIASYLASKAAIEQLTRVAAVELGREASPPTSCRRASPILTSCGP